VVIVEANTRNPVRLLSKVVVLCSIFLLPKKYHLVGHCSEFFHLIGTYKRLLKKNNVPKMCVEYKPIVDLRKLYESDSKAAKLYYLNAKVFGKLSPRFYSMDVVIHGKKERPKVFFSGIS
jgi:hypothetical protein